MSKAFIHLNPVLTLLSFFDDIGRFTAKDYIPIEADILRCKARTAGITETRFTMGRLPIRLIGIDEQTSFRKKWIHVFEGATSIIFVVDLACYDEVLFGSQNALMEQLDYFDNIVNSRWFMHTSIILLFNNVDTFRSKLALMPLAHFFPDYSGGDDLNRAVKYLLWRFHQVNRAHLSFYPHLLRSTDTSYVPLVHAAVNKTIRENFVRSFGIVTKKKLG